MKQLYLSLFAGLLACSAIRAQAPQYVVVPTASTLPSSTNEQCFTLNQFNPHTAGAVWSQEKMSLSGSFVINTRLYFGNGMYPGQADGIAFVLQRTANNIVGQDGGGLGYGGITPSFIVEFDTYQNATPGGYDNGDPAGDHVGFQKNGSPSHLTNALKAPQEIPFDIENDQWYNVQFAWDANTKTMTVTGFGQTYVYSGDIVNTIFGGDPMVYWGLTAGTGSVDNVAFKACIGTVTIIPPAPITLGCGQLRTQTMGGWGQKAAGNNNGAYRDAHFASAFAAAPYNGKVTVGSMAPGGRYMQWNSSAAVQNFLPSGTTPRIIDASAPALNATSGQYKNNAVGQVLTLSLTVRFDDTDPAFAPSALPIGDYIIRSGVFAGWTVRAFLAEANNVLAGLSSAYTVDQVHTVAGTINEAYDDGKKQSNYLMCPTSSMQARGGRDGQEVTDAQLMDGPQEARLIANVFPNPTKGIVNLRVSNNTDRIEVRVVNARGMVVERMNTNSQVISLDLKKYGAGIYMVQIVSGTSVRTERVIVQD